MFKQINQRYRVVLHYYNEIHTLFVHHPLLINALTINNINRESNGIDQLLNMESEAAASKKALVI